MANLFSFVPLFMEERQNSDNDIPLVDFSDREVETDKYYILLERLRPIVEKFLSQINYDCLYDDDCINTDENLKREYLFLINMIQNQLEQADIHIKTYRDALLEIIEDDEIVSQLEKLA